jgi:hypothetical protein
MSSDNPDIREQVDASRGFSKKLQLLVPGLRGYRQLEDVRAADEILRNQVGDKLDIAKGNLESVRKDMANNGDFANLTKVGSLISQIQQLSGNVRHSAQGYSGFAPTIRVDENTLNRLYEYDYNFVNSAVMLQTVSSPANFSSVDPATFQNALSKVGSAVNDFKTAWQQRLEAVENILLK